MQLTQKLGQLKTQLGEQEERIEANYQLEEQQVKKLLGGSKELAAVREERKQVRCLVVRSITSRMDSCYMHVAKVERHCPVSQIYRACAGAAVFYLTAKRFLMQLQYCACRAACGHPMIGMMLY